MPVENKSCYLGTLKKWQNKKRTESKEKALEYNHLGMINTMMSFIFYTRIMENEKSEKIEVVKNVSKK